MNNNCKNCGAKCCQDVEMEQGRYLGPQTDETIRWLKYHQNIDTIVYDTKIGKLWKVKIKSKCNNLSKDGSCQVYGTDKYPRACREYIGISPSGPNPDCQLFRDLLREDKIVLEDWMRLLWGEDVLEKWKQDFL